MAEANEIFNEEEIPENEETKVPKEGGTYPCAYCKRKYSTA